MILGIDPGVSTGWSLWTAKGEFAGAGASGGDFPLVGVTHAAIERPQIYRASQSKGDPNDIVTLAIQVGQYKERLEARGVKVTLVLPTTWKGQLKKEIHHARILGSLPEVEKVRVVKSLETVAKSHRHDTLDAIGLGLWLIRSGKV